MRLSLIVALLLGTSGFQPADAAPMVDQAHVLTQSTGGRIIYAGNSPAQTFTVGAGGLLSQVDVLLYRQAGDIGDLSLELWPVVAEGPAGSTPLFSMPIDPNDVPLNSAAYVPIDVSAGGLSVTPGERYAIAVNGTADLDSPYGVWSGGLPGYAAGERFNHSGSWSYQTSSTDYGFRTWVDPAGVGLSELQLTPTGEWDASLSSSGASVIFTAGDTMRVDRSTTFDEDERGLMEFDASGLPPGAVITSATLDFEINQRQQSGSIVPIVDVYGYEAVGQPTDAAIRPLSRRLGGSDPIEDFSPVSVSLDPLGVNEMLEDSTGIGLMAYAAAPPVGISMIASQLAQQLPTIYDPPTLTLNYSAPDTPVPVPVPAGDYNRDARVDAADYTVWRDATGTLGDSPADGDNDGDVDQQDYDLWSANYGTAPDATVANGGFENGDLSEWEVVVEPNTNVSFGFPRVESFDVDGDGQPSDAMRVRLGRSDTSQFGGTVAIEQELLLAAGDYELSADVASQSLQDFGNNGPGNFELTLDGVIVDQVLLDGTSIGAFEVIRESLLANLTDVQAGYHTLRIAVSRGATNSRAIYQFIDNIAITQVSNPQAVPEPSAWVVAAWALAAVVGRRRHA